MKLKKLDYVIIGVLILITIFSSLAVLLRNRTQYDEKYVVISVDGKLYKKVRLDNHSETIRINSKEGENVISIANGKVAVAEADCPDKICIKDGPISKPGQILVCLPNKVVIEIKGQRTQEIDGSTF